MPGPATPPAATTFRAHVPKICVCSMAGAVACGNAVGGTWPWLTTRPSANSAVRK